MAVAGRSADQLTAVLIATAATPDATPAALLGLDGGTLLGRLADQLRGAGAGRITVVTRPEWARVVAAAVAGVDVCPAAGLADVLGQLADTADQGAGPIVVAAGELLVHDGVVAGLLSDPRLRSGAVVSSRIPRGSYARVRLDRGRLVAAESPYHRVGAATGSFRGLLLVDGGHRADLAAVSRQLAEMTAGGLPDGWERELAVKVRGWGEEFFAVHGPQADLARHLQGRDGRRWLPDAEQLRSQLQRRFAEEVLAPAEAAASDAAALVLTALVRRGTPLTGSDARGLVCERPLSAREAAAVGEAMAAVDEDRVLLDASVKAGDGFFTTFFVSPYSKHLARAAARAGLTPNQVTTASLLLGLAAAAAFAAGSRPWLVAGAVLLQVAFTLDCVDGQLARYTRRFSAFGGWLDSVFDRSKEYAVYAGLAAGAARSGDEGMWLLAGAALALQVARHSMDFTYAVAERARSVVPGMPLVEPDERPPAARAAAPASPSQALVRRALRRMRSWDSGWTQWPKRALVLPIGERFALISLTAALGGPRTTFVALLAWGAVAASYSLAGRLLRSLL